MHAPPGGAFRKRRKDDELSNAFQCVVRRFIFYRINKNSFIWFTNHSTLQNSSPKFQQLIHPYNLVCFPQVRLWLHVPAFAYFSMLISGIAYAMTVIFKQSYIPFWSITEGRFSCPAVKNILNTLITTEIHTNWRLACTRKETKDSSF